MTQDQKLLLAEASDSLNAAELPLANHFPGFAASRGYYAMFHAAQAMLDSLGLSFSSHSATIAAFGREFAKPGKVPVEFHRWLLGAQDARLTADYDASMKVSPEYARELLDRARQVTETASRLLSHSDS